MIGVQLAQQLREAGLTWKPAIGDRFAIPDRDLDEEVFVLSNMTIEVYSMPEGRVIGFNGTTEWAMDDVELDETVWLPREDQLRELLGGTFRSLARGPAGYEVRIDLLGEERSFAGENVEQAYAAALLHLLAAAGAA
ncbi:pilus assembly protein CpaE [Actinoplanes bogorensis]|uniref:Pilus assembly protein CpaE n=1 Tax=Paractinoplanes bogorensis TaxID=1610840 RepID=A0ABS5Z5T8_9ACTN|nr:pilus assembly protein CpaE [Actinoplanes bogorensis]MBU2670906.1 pilus assembly protein CpaE [Actinoplanes bogorensis]